MLEPSNISFDKKINILEEKLAIFETKILNPLGYIPFVSSFSAAARATLSLTQGIAALSFASYYAFKSLNAKEDEQEILHNKVWRCLNQGAHAVLNNGRAEVEAVPVLGNIAVLIYDLALKERFKYPDESKNPLETIIKEKYNEYKPIIDPIIKNCREKIEFDLFYYLNLIEKKVLN